MIDTGMAMVEKNGFSKDMVGACFKAFPASLASAGVDYNKFCAHMTR